MARIFVNEIGQEIRNIIETQHTDLTSVSYGDLSLLPNPDIIGSVVPLVIVEPIDVGIEQKTYTGSLELAYRYTIYYVTSIQQGTVPKEALCTKGLPIAETILDNVNLSNLVIANLDINGIKITGLSIDNDVNSFFETIEMPLMALKIDIEVQTYSNL